jgi:hypothetical protein
LKNENSDYLMVEISNKRLSWLLVFVLDDDFRYVAAVLKLSKLALIFMHLGSRSVFVHQCVSDECAAHGMDILVID